QLAYRHNGSTTALTGTLTPATVSGITDKVVCANTAGTAITIEGNSVTCATLSATALTAGDWIETIGGAADGTSNRMSIAATWAENCYEEFLSYCRIVSVFGHNICPDL